MSALALAGCAATVALVALGVIGSIFDVESLRIVGVLGVFLLGPGSALVSLAPTDNRADEPLLLLTTGLAVAIAVGFVMIETTVWHPDDVAVVAAGLVLVIEGYAIAGLLRRERASGDTVLGVVRRGTRRLGAAVVAFARTLAVPSILLTAVGTCVWFVSAIVAGHVEAGIGGFLVTISPAWYVGLAMVVGGVIFASRVTSRAVGLATVSIVAALTLTPALVYGEPRSTTAAKHVGVTLLLMAKHRADPSIDIYNAWPGFFSAVAWACDVAGIHDPMVVARWWPVLMGGLEIVGLVTLASKLLGTGYRAWMAALFGYLVNTVGQDYYSPQSVAFVLALVIFACAMYVEHETPRSRWCRIAVIVLASLALAVTHQLSPYVVTVVLVVLVVFRVARPRWLPAVPLVPALGWAAVHWHSIRDYLHADQIGSLTNLETPRTTGGAGLHRLAIVDVSAASVVAAGVVLALLALWALGGQRSRLQVNLACCCVASVILGLANPYGNEAIFRGVLFASPWLGIMAVSMPLVGLRIRWALAGAVPVLVATFLLAAFGLDASTVIRSGDLVAEGTFERSAPTGSILLGVGTGNLPVQPTANYHNFSEISRTTAEMSSSAPSKYNAALDVRYLTEELRLQYPYAPSYWAIWSPTQAYFEEEYGVATVKESEELERTMAQSGYWKPVLTSDDSVLFRLDVDRAPSARVVKK
jgi:hypothetical protein